MAHIRLYYRAGAKLIALLASRVVSTHHVIQLKEVWKLPGTEKSHHDNYLAPAASDTPQESELGSRPATTRGSLYIWEKYLHQKGCPSHRLRNPPNPIMSKFFPVITGIIVAIVGTAGAVAQLITPAPVPPTQYVQKRAFDSSWAAANQKCWSTGAPCQYPDFFHACQAEWKGLDYLWCLCTTGYYEALHTFAIPSPW